MRSPRGLRTEWPGCRARRCGAWCGARGRSTRIDSCAARRGRVLSPRRLCWRAGVDGSGAGAGAAARRGDGAAAGASAGEAGAFGRPPEGGLPSCGH